MTPSTPQPQPPAGTESVTPTVLFVGATLDPQAIMQMGERVGLPPVALEQVATSAQARSRLRSALPAVLVCEVSDSPEQARDLLAWLKAQPSTTRCIVYATQALDAAALDRWYAAGAWDVVCSEYAARLPYVIRNALQTDRLQQDMAHQDEQIHILQESSLQLGTQLAGVDELFDLLLHQSIRLLPGRYVWLVSVDSERTERVQGYATEGSVPELDNSLLLHALRPIDRRLFARTDQTPWEGIFANSDIAHLLIAPIHLHTRELGWLIFADSRLRPHHQTDLHILNAFTGLVSVSLWNALLFERMIETTTELAALYNATSVLFTGDTVEALADQIAQSIVREFRQVDCGVLLLEPNSRHIRRVSRAGSEAVRTQAPLSIDDAGLVPSAIRENRLIYAPDVRHDPRYVDNEPGIQSEMVIPLRARGHEVLGVLDLQSRQRDAFSESDLRTLTAFAERAALALENMRMYEGIKAYARLQENEVQARTTDLQRTNEEVAALLNNSSDAILFVTHDGVIRRVNPAIQTLCNITPQAALGQPFDQYIVEGQRASFLQALRRVVQSDQPTRIECQLRQSGDAALHVDIAMGAVDLQQGGRGAVCSVRDISAQKARAVALYDALQHERALVKLKNQFISTASHQFRTPLAVIKNTKDFLTRYDDRLDADRRAAKWQQIDQAVQDLTSLMDDVLTISRVDMGKMTLNPASVNPRQIVEVLVRHIEDSYTRPDTIHLQVDGVPDELVLDERLLRHIVSNLLSNAAKYSPEQSPIEVYLTYAEADETLGIDVRDHGIGIPAQDIERIFEPFSRASNVKDFEGTGLGLAIVQRAVSLYGGRMWAESTVGAGTTFYVRLPLAHAAEGDAAD